MQRTDAGLVVASVSAVVDRRRRDQEVSIPIGAGEGRRTGPFLQGGFGRTCNVHLFGIRVKL
jgi:hypothetical protein